MRRLAIALLALYPSCWRDRYGPEMRALLEEHPVRPATLADLLAGAIDARLDPAYRAKEETMTGATGRPRRYTRCSFCGKGQDQVKKLVAGPGVFICDACIELCNEVLAADGGGPCGEPPAPTPGPRPRARWRTAVRGWLRSLLRSTEIPGAERTRLHARLPGATSRS